MSPKRVDPAERRATILAAAVRVFARKGFAASRIDDIAAEAGVSKGGVYSYFESRDAILRAGFDEFAAGSTALLDRIDAGEAPALDRLAALIESTVAMLASRPELAGLLLDLWSTGRQAADPGLNMATVYSQYRTSISRLLRQGEAEGTVRAGLGPAHATVIVGAIEGCLMQWLVDPGVPIDSLAGPITQVCLAGVAAEHTGGEQ